MNIYFPEAAADSAAKTIVRDVLGEEPTNVERAPDTPDKGSMLEGKETGWAVFVKRMVDVLIQPAYAQADIKINTPVINSIRASLKQRQPQLQPSFSNGALGLTGDGLVAIRDQGAIALKDRNRVKKLVADENADRNALYREIAKANGHPEWENDIRKTFARVWVEESPSGIWYQNDAGQWVTK